jgi:hypothetical protein
MNDERTRILEMLSAGKISVEEANQLLEAASKREQELSATGKGTSHKFIYVQVEPKDTAEGKKTGKVFVKVPFVLIKAGFNIAGLIPKDAWKQINDELKGQGMSFDLSDIKPENIKEVMESLELLTVEVDNADSHIQIYCK